MANLSNINNKFLFTDGDFLKIGNSAPINNVSSTESGISVINSNVASLSLTSTAATGKTYALMSEGPGGFRIRDVDANIDRLVINSSGDATFAGDITLNEDLNFSTNGFADISNTGTGAMRFKPSSQTLALTLTGANATFAGLVYSGDGFRTSSSNSSYNLLTRNNGNGSYPFYCQNSLGVSGDAAIARFAYGSYGANTGTAVLDVRSGASYFNDCNLGIGTTSPTEGKLVVVGRTALKASSNTEVALSIQRSSSTGRSQYTLETETGSQIWRCGMTGPGSTDYGFFDGVQNAMTIKYRDHILLTPAGNVGIGTVLPSKKLEVAGSYKLGTNGFIEYGGGYPYTINIENTAGAGDVTIKSGAGYNRILLQPSTSGIEFYTGNSERMRIQSNGNVGIGETSPGTKLTIRQVDDTFNDLDLLQLKRVWSTASGTDRSHGISFNDTNATLVKIYADRTNSGSNYDATLKFLVNSGTNGTSLVEAASISHQATLQVNPLAGSYGIRQNGVSSISNSGYVNGNSALSINYDTKNQGSMFIECVFNHYGFISNYGCARIATVANGPNIQVNDIQNISSTNGGSWTISRVSNNRINISKTAGTYAGAGHWFINIRGNDVRYT